MWWAINSCSTARNSVIHTIFWRNSVIVGRDDTGAAVSAVSGVSWVGTKAVVVAITRPFVLPKFDLLVADMWLPRHGRAWVLEAYIRPVFHDLDQYPAVTGGARRQARRGRHIRRPAVG